MTFECKLCKERCNIKRNNSFYCPTCTKIWNKKKAKLFKANNIFIWVRNNSIIRVLFEDKNIEPVFIRSEVIK